MSDAARHDDRYRARGASAGKGEVHAAISRQDLGLFPGAFCKIVRDDLTGDDAYGLVVHADGAGTKSSLAYLAWKEGFPLAVWRGIAQDSLVMNLDDCACVGAMGPFLVSNTVGRNAKRIPGEVIAALVDGYQAVCDTLTDLGIPCRMTGGETADLGDLVRTVVVDSTVVCRVRRDRVIDAARIAPGDVIVGFSSTGQAAWETELNHGMGSNGLTAARHELLGGGYRQRYPETWSPEMAADLAYAGPFAVGDALPGAPGVTVGQALLSPTRTYLPLIRDLIAAIPVEDLHGLIHCSGGGQSKIVRFGRPGAADGLRFVKDAPFPVPPLFRALKERTHHTWAELYSVYNCGWRLEAVVPPRRVQACLDAAQAARIEARVVGRVEAKAGPGNEVVVTTPDGPVTYR
jgi:phosphoribosylformylglycinamidine cyclo-ligase